MNGDALPSADCKAAWDQVEKVWGGGWDKVPCFLDIVFNVPNVEKQRADPSVPHPRGGRLRGS